MTRKRYRKLFQAIWSRSAQHYQLPNVGQSLRGIRDARANGMSYEDLWRGLSRSAIEFGIGRNGS